MRLAIPCIAGAMVISVGLGAFEPNQDRQALEEALSIGQSRIEPVRARFHRAYRIDVGQAPVDFLEVVTPFRRVELAVEARARAGDRMFGLADAQRVLAASSGLSIRAELTFHPHNTFVTVPRYDVELIDSAKQVVRPTHIDRTPRFGLRVDGYPLPTAPGSPVLPGGSQPLTGGSLDADFALSSLDTHAIYDVIVRDGNQTLSRSRVNFATLR